MSDGNAAGVPQEADGERLGLPALVDSRVPPEVESWLARLALLYGVPFEHLAAEETMLPTESMRFFYLDAGWVQALVDGAFSVGVHSQRDLRFHHALHATVREATAAAAGRLRRDIRGEDTAGAEPAGASVRGGFLLRSEIVSGWPGLEVAGYDDDEPVPLLRLERLAPDLMVCLFGHVPAQVVLSEPQEGLHFAITGSTVTVRDLDTSAGSASTRTVDVVWRPATGPTGVGENGRVDLSATARAIAGEKARPGDVAAQLTATAREQHFVPDPAGATGADSA